MAEDKKTPEQTTQNGSGEKKDKKLGDGEGPCGLPKKCTIL